jgi:hypothetical protein
MNSQEFRALQEAYNQVYNELDESKGEELRKKHKMEPGETASQRLAARAHDKEFNIPRQTPAQILDNPHLDKKKSTLKKLSRKAWSRVEQNNEAVDLYNIILSHLLDEGYADTEQAAEVIMVNMSEDWREDIVEAAADQSDKQIDKGVKTTYKAQNVLDNQHQGRSRGLNRLPADQRADKTKKMRGRLKARRDDLFGERNKREDESRAELKKKYGL